MWEPPLSPCLEELGFVKNGGAICEQVRVLGNALGALYDKSTDCKRSGKAFTGMGDELYKQLECKSPQEEGTWEDV